MKYKAFKAENVNVSTSEYIHLREKLTENKTNVSVKKKRYRRRFFGLSGEQPFGLSDVKDNHDVYSIYWEPDKFLKLYIEKVSRRDGCYYKQSEPLMKQQYQALAEGNYEWLNESPYQLLREVYLQININDIQLGQVVEMEKEIITIGAEKIAVHFTTSVGIMEDDLFTNNLYHTPYLERDEIIASYRKSITIPTLYANALMQQENQPKVQAL